MCRGVLKTNALLTGLSYMFDCIMRSFLQNYGEFFSPLCVSSCDTIITEANLPRYDDLFKDCVDIICQPLHTDLYDRIKRFCIDNWISIYNSNSDNKTHHYNQYKKQVVEIIHDFEIVIANELKEILDVEYNTFMEVSTLREHTEQIIMNMVRLALHLYIAGIIASLAES